MLSLIVIYFIIIFAVLKIFTNRKFNKSIVASILEGLFLISLVIVINLIFGKFINNSYHTYFLPDSNDMIDFIDKKSVTLATLLFVFGILLCCFFFGKKFSDGKYLTLFVAFVQKHYKITIFILAFCLFEMCNSFIVIVDINQVRNKKVIYFYNQTIQYISSYSNELPLYYSNVIPKNNYSLILDENISKSFAIEYKRSFLYKIIFIYNPNEFYEIHINPNDIVFYD